MTRSVRASVVAGAALAVLGGIGTLVSASYDPRRALLAWLSAFGFGVATVLAGLILAMVLHVTHARWWVALRPLLMAIVATLRVFVLLFVPIALGVHYIYPWARPTVADVASLPETVARALEHQRTWNNPAFFLVRSVVYFGAWLTLVLRLERADRLYLRAPTSELPERFEAQRRVSGAGLPILALTMSFAASDWLMSVEPAWVSNAFGVYVFCGGLVSAVSALAVAIWLARRAGLLPPEVGPSHVHAVGRLMLMAVILWAYIGFFQLMLVWIADIPRESSFFGARAKGQFLVVDWILVLGHFVLPFFALLSRPLKRSPGGLAAVGAGLIVVSALDFAWMVMPQVGFLGALDAAPFLVVFGIVLAYAAIRAGVGVRAPSEVRAVDPVLRESLRYRSP